MYVTVATIAHSCVHILCSPMLSASIVCDAQSHQMHPQPTLEDLLYASKQCLQSVCVCVCV